MCQVILTGFASCPLILICCFNYNWLFYRAHLYFFFYFFLFICFFIILAIFLIIFCFISANWVNCMQHWIFKAFSMLLKIMLYARNSYLHYFAILLIWHLLHFSFGNLFSLPVHIGQQQTLHFSTLNFITEFLLRFLLLLNYTWFHKAFALKTICIIKSLI